MDLNIGDIHWVRAASLLVAVLLILNWLRSVILDPLRGIPGPFIARFTRLWLLRQYIKGNYHKTNIELHKEYGPIVRIAPGQYSIDSVDAARMIYGHGTLFTKADWYQPWGTPHATNLFNEQNAKQHAEDRRKVANAYSMTSMVSYEPYVEACTNILSQRLSEFAEAGLPADMGHWLQCYAFDTIGMITFGSRFGFLDAGQDIHELIKVLTFTATMSSTVGVYAWLFPLVPKLIQTLSPKGEVKGPAVLGDYAEKQVSAFKKQPPPTTGPESFMTKFFRLQQERPNYITDRSVLIAASGNIAAGSDTTSISLSAILYHLCKNPRVMQKLRAELDTHIQSGSVSEPITFNQAQNLPYLQAVIKEGLRIHPATGFTMPRIVPKGGKVLAGQWFPEGSTVGINSWVAHQNPEVYGQDAYQFRPERWLEEGSYNKNFEAYFFAFGQGSRTCIGKNISLLEISKGIPQLIRHFDFAFVGGEELVCQNHWFVKPVNFNCVVTKRKKHEGAVGDAMSR